jgi:branched-chain amino acid transport system permease protein
MPMTTMEQADASLAGRILRNKSKVFSLLFAVLLAAPLLVRDQYFVDLMIVTVFFAAQAMVFDFTAGYINVVNFGFAGFVGFGAYVSALLAVNLGASPWLTIWAGAAGSAALGWLTGILTLRLRGIFAAVMAWFVSLTLFSLASALVPLTRGFLGFNVPLFLETSDRRPYFYLILVLAAVSFLFLRAATRSHLGLAFRALGQNLETARASGVSPRKYRVMNFTISCFVAGLLGGFYGHSVGILTPDVMHTRHTVEVLALAYIGGRGTLWGGALAAFLIIPLFESLRPLFEIRLILYGLLLVATIIVYPRGLAALFDRRSP